MAESPLSEKLQLMLNEEKWTRTLMANYSVVSLKELDRFIDETTAQGITDDIIKTCTDHLSQTKNSVIALYVAGILNIMRQPADESFLVQLMDLFADSKKNNIIEYICNRMLDFGENRIALMRLAECYTDENKIEQRYGVWERLVRIDTEEAELAQLIAEWKEKNGQFEDAIDFYKKALIRYINKGLFANIKEIWLKLIELSPEDMDFFLHAQKKIAKQISPEKAAMLLTDLYAWYKKSEKWETALNILKLIIEYDERNPALRKEFLDCYTAIYSGHSMFDECVRLSNLTQTYRSLHEAIADFEKRIAFDKGNYVFHRTWNIGRISNITNDEVVVDFAKSRNHHMSLKMAFDSLTTLSRDHIWVLKATWPREKLRDKVKTDPAWAIKIIIKSFDNRADMKRIKAELVPSVLSPSEWNSWSSRAKDILKTDPMFGNAQDDISTFIVRDRPLSFEEKIYAQFKAEKNFFARVQFFRDYIEMSNDLDTDYFEDMLSYFVSFLKLTQANEFMIGSYLLVKELSSRYPRLQQHVTMRFADLFGQIKDNIVPIYLALKDTELRNQLIQNIKTFVSNWPDVYIQLLPYARSAKMLDALESAGQEENLKRMAMYIVENYKDMREAFIWLARDLKDKPWLKELGIVREKIILTLLHILDITFKEIDSHKDTTENRKINKLVQNILFKEKDLEEFLEEAPQQVTERVYSMLADIKEVDPAIKLDLKKKISERYPNIKFYDGNERLTVSRGLMVTAVKYEEKKHLLGHIMEVDVPANQKEIAFALSLGDLRENAEYKAAKEKQDELNSKVGKLKNELDRAQIIGPEHVDASNISFGTKLTLKNLANGEEEIFTILGPWESDPENQIISYLSPLGKHLLNHKTGETLNFTINERKFSYKVLKIVKAEF
ncbi:MAG: transcription elongation factor GreA [Rectinema sp.]|jgi:transcription elongation factor GreA